MKIEIFADKYISILNPDNFILILLDLFLFFYLSVEIWNITLLLSFPSNVVPHNIFPKV